MNKKSFIVGAIVGALISALIHLIMFRPPRPPFHGAPPDPEQMEMVLLNHFSRELDLSPEQREQIAPIIFRLNRKMMEFKLSRAGEMDKLFDEANAAMIPLLSESQQKKLAEGKLRMDRERHREEEFLHREKSAPPEPRP